MLYLGLGAGASGEESELVGELVLESGLGLGKDKVRSFVGV